MKMTLGLAIAAMIWAGTAPVFADDTTGIEHTTSGIEIRDPEGILPLVDQFLGQMSFEEAFQKGDRTIVRRFDLKNNTSKEHKIYVRKRDSNKVIISERTGFLGLGHKDDKILRSDWEAGKGNMVRVTMNTLQASSTVNGQPTEYHLRIVSAYDEAITLRDGKTVQAVTVTFALMTPSFWNPLDYDEAFRTQVTVGKDVPAISQVLRLALVDRTGAPIAGSTGSEILWTKRK